MVTRSIMVAPTVWYVSMVTRYIIVAPTVWYVLFFILFIIRIDLILIDLLYIHEFESSDILMICKHLRDRPFNLKGGGGGRGYGFLFRSEFFFRTTQELEIFFQYLTLGYMTKTLNQIIFLFSFSFPPPKSKYFFQQHWESEYFFRKNNNPLLQVKWSFP